MEQAANNSADFVIFWFILCSFYYWNYMIVQLCSFKQVKMHIFLQNTACFMAYLVVFILFFAKLLYILDIKRHYFCKMVYYFSMGDLFKLKRCLYSVVMTLKLVFTLKIIIQCILTWVRWTAKKYFTFIILWRKR